MKKLLLLTVLLCGLSACDLDIPVSAEKDQTRKTEQLQSEANRQVGMPNITRFQERKFAKMILEMRDKAITTYTYFIDMNGKKHFICESVGYGLPYSVQFTNPMKKEYGANGGSIALPQADPNGLYMPDGLSATWVLCSDGDGGTKPVYVEPQIMVSPFKMNKGE